MWGGAARSREGSTHVWKSLRIEFRFHSPSQRKWLLLWRQLFGFVKHQHLDTNILWLILASLIIFQREKRKEKKGLHCASVWFCFSLKIIKLFLIMVSFPIPISALFFIPCHYLVCGSWGFLRFLVAYITTAVPIAWHLLSLCWMVEGWGSSSGGLGLVSQILIKAVG